MKKTLLFSFIAAAAAASAAPSDAQALDTCSVGCVTILNAFAPVPLGTWHAELLNYSDYNGPEVCSYFIKWVNAGFALANTTNLFVDEFIIPGFADCEWNSVNSVPTTIFDSPDYQ